MNRFMASCLSLTLVLGLACTGPKVHYDYDSQAGFAQYHSFDWQAASAGQQPDGIMANRIKRLVAKELESKSFRQETGADPDFLVTVATSYTREPGHSGVRVGLGGGLGLVGVGVSTALGSGHSTRSGSIILEVTDFKTRKLVWKGVAEAVLDDRARPEEVDEDVAVAVTKILKRFPPEPGVR